MESLPADAALHGGLYFRCRDHAVTNGQRQAATGLTIARFPLSGMNPNTVGPPAP
jgi:hypothetical protein